jgi:hypothetical protein
MGLLLALQLLQSRLLLLQFLQLAQLLLFERSPQTG